jgi:hypothetical protein
MAVTRPIEYVGSELALFERAVNWKRYWSAAVEPYVRGDALEVGAGIGANTRVLAGLPHRTWTSLEPDAALAARIPSIGPAHRRLVGTLADLKESFDTILYIDVLEHIADDRAEMARAAERLHPSGHVIVLSPALPSLYSPFDKAMGHFRRYTRASLAATAAATSLRLVKLIYLDSAGLLASAANRFLYSRPLPTETQIAAWDRLLVPVSRILDPLLAHAIGKSVLGVWRREA